VAEQTLDQVDVDTPAKQAGGVGVAPAVREVPAGEARSFPAASTRSAMERGPKAPWYWNARAEFGLANKYGTAPEPAG
jgi:hypothetical protein